MVIIQGDCLQKMKDIKPGTVDLVVTDPPYGYSFMGKDWDKVVPPVDIWKECLRVLKPGAFCFVMSAPRQDVLSRMIVNLEGAGFNMGFTSIYWAYASGFPKAGNVGKLVDKRAGVERKRNKINAPNIKGNSYNKKEKAKRDVMMQDDNPITHAAKALDGSYTGFQPKPAVEIIIIAMKPLSEKTYVDQALKNQKGVMWLDDGRIPFEGEPPTGSGKNDTWRESENRKDKFQSDNLETSPKGRFPANLLVSDDVLNDGKITKSNESDYNFEESNNDNPTHITKNIKSGIHHQDAGSFSRYFDLDAWALENGFPQPDLFGNTDKGPKDVFPFMIVPKESKSEKNHGLDGMEKKFTKTMNDGIGEREHNKNEPTAYNQNFHPTVKPLKLMAYLITLASRPGDTILDPFMGSGTTGVACALKKRKFIGIELDENYFSIAKKRIEKERNIKDVKKRK